MFDDIMCSTVSTASHCSLLNGGSRKRQRVRITKKGVRMLYISRLGAFENSGKNYIHTPWRKKRLARRKDAMFTSAPLTPVAGRKSTISTVARAIKVF